MTIEGIIAGLKEMAETFDLGEYGGYIKDAVDALKEVDKNLDEAYAAGKYDQLCEDFEMVVKSRKEKK